MAVDQVSCSLPRIRPCTSARLESECERVVLSWQEEAGQKESGSWGVHGGDRECLFSVDPVTP